MGNGILVQVAGIRDEDELGLVLDAGVDWVGFPLRLEVHRPDSDDETVRRMAVKTRAAGRTPVLITYLNQRDAVLDLLSDLDIEVVQLHGDVDLEVCASLRHARPALTIVKSVVFGERPAGWVIERALKFVPLVDWLITDTFDPRSGARGATGRVHDWTLSAELVRRSGKPVMLAGGLNPSNVGGAITRVRPAGVDVHSGVESADGSKDGEKVRAFVDAARRV